mmetsp:Transcript_8466/g.18179  ORF Transcript_8466/g.18179 Transcript_8466/m.18179 type:complete len:659 (-) Transcript_8466:455-2431(-)
MKLIARQTLILLLTKSYATTAASEEVPLDLRDADSTLFDSYRTLQNDIAKRKIQQAKLDLWLRGAFDLDERNLSPAATDGDISSIWDVVTDLEKQAAMAPLRHRPYKDVRRRLLQAIELDNVGYRGQVGLSDLWKNVLTTRGGETGDPDESYSIRLDAKLAKLSAKFGKPFIDAIEKNKAEHAADCSRSCEIFYCADETSTTKWNGNETGTSFVSYSFGSVPPEDFSEEFRFPLDLIKVTQGDPLFSAEESAMVIAQAEEEGVDNNEYKSGKYKLGGDWLVNLPKTRTWLNTKLKTTLFPLLHDLFPEIIRSPSVLRAHSVSLLKYNSTHPRTDVHVDNGILAMTLAMTPQSEYVGGGTFYEHMGIDNILQMDVGHGTFRPGSVRHGGHRVTSGTRYILGAFLLLEDHVEHVRRLKNRGAKLRTRGDLTGAVDHFEWALALNPRCTTCLKDWAEILLSQKRFAEAEEKIQQALDYLEGQDSDALFTLGLILSEQGKNAESISVYKKSLELNAEDAQLCYNLGIKLGEQGDSKGELAMYAKATEIDPTMGGAWLNMGTTLAESGNLNDAEFMFMKAVECGDEAKTKSMLNLALLLQKKANTLASGGDLNGAKIAIIEASELLDKAKSFIDANLALGGLNSEDAAYAAQFRPMRIQCIGS